MVSFPPPPPPARPADERRAFPEVARTVFDALDAVLEEGVPRTALADAALDTRHVEQWIRGFAHAEDAIAAVRGALHGAAPARLAPDDPAIVRLLVAAAALAALARAAALTAPAHPTLAALERAVDEAFAFALTTRNRAIWHALSTAAA
jgi:hypothetical protein